MNKILICKKLEYFEKCRIEGINKIVGSQINEEMNLLLIIEIIVSIKKIEQKIETKKARCPKSSSIKACLGKNA